MDSKAEKTSQTIAKAHFDGQQIVPDEPLKLAAGTRLIVSALPEALEKERDEWSRLAAAGLVRGSSGRENGPRDIKPNRVLAVILGVGYLLLIAAAFHAAANWSYAVALLVTIVGAAIIMATLAALGVRVYRMYRSKGSCARFSFSTIFLVSIPLSVYLAGIRVFVQRAPWQEIGFGGMLFILVLGASWMIISTAILLCLAEAIVAIAVGIFRWRRRMFPGHCRSI